MSHALDEADRARVVEMARGAEAQSIGDDLWLAFKTDAGQTRLLTMRREPGCIRAALTVHETLDLDGAWAFGGDAADQHADLEATYETLARWVGDATTLRLDSPPADHLLIVKVSSDAHWLLRFPLSVYAQAKMGFLRRYRRVEWVVTDKTFLQHRGEAQALDADLRDFATFLDGAVVILNTYREFAALPSCVDGMRALLDALALARDIQVADAGAGANLRWYLNPPADVILRLLADRKTRYVFANFEAATGSWETGEGSRQSWDDGSSSVDPDHGSRVVMDLSGLGDLSHIRLMRVFHCFSVFDPSRPALEPAHRESITARLLGAGPWRVEGGMTREMSLDFLASVATILLDQSGLGFVLPYKALEVGADWEEISTRLRRIVDASNSMGG